LALAARGYTEQHESLPGTKRPGAKGGGPVGIGASLFLIAVGAILRFAVTADVTEVNLNMIGVILMIIGGIGFIVTAALMFTRRRTDVIQHDRGTTYVTPRSPYEAP
jgi:hypothetical protein